MTIIERPGVCTLDCPDTCSLTAEVDANRIVKVRCRGTRKRPLPCTNSPVWCATLLQMTPSV